MSSWIESCVFSLISGIASSLEVDVLVGFFAARLFTFELVVIFFAGEFEFDFDIEVVCLVLGAETELTLPGLRLLVTGYKGAAAPYFVLYIDILPVAVAVLFLVELVVPLFKALLVI